MLLPRGKQVKSPFNPKKMNWPDAVVKLREGRFSGYLHCWGTSGSGILLFDSGRLATVRFYSRSGELLNAEAFERIFFLSLTGEMTLAIYRVSRELSSLLHSVLGGEILYRGQQLCLLDIPHVLQKLTKDRFSGCLRVGAGQEFSLVFFKKGAPIGFFHDDSLDLTRTADLERSTARIPGATLDIIAGVHVSEGDIPDLVESHDLEEYWDRAVKKAQVTV
ncbi:MAG: hypothetical protein R2940_11095 [Syntrophotaleaceae bacterium]